MREASLRILGVMTGTSCDGLDAACIELYRDGWEAGWSGTAPYPPWLRRRVLRMQLPGARQTIHGLLELHRDLGEWYGETLARIIRKNRDALPDLIANHGQTVAHFPEPKGLGMTLQIGDPTRISRATGLTVVTRLRDGDLSAGGQGAPLATVFHKALAAHLDRGGSGVAIHNIGGISNLTYIGPEGKSAKKSAIIAFDTGPGNLWMDAAAGSVTRGRLRFDRDGKLAARGRPDRKAVDAILRWPFFAKAPPKSTGRDDFPFNLFIKSTRAGGADLVATAAAVTVESIARAYERWILGRRLPLRRIFIAGGGAKNPTLLRELGARLDPVRVTALTDAGFDSQLIEAQACAYLGFLSLMGQPLGGGWTGAKGFGSPGQLVPGENWLKILEKLREF